MAEPTTLWWLALAAIALVAVVVAVLLGLIIAAARSVDGHAKAIWTAGKEIAGNTQCLWMLAPIRDELSKTADAIRGLRRAVTGAEDQAGSGHA